MYLAIVSIKNIMDNIVFGNRVIANRSTCYPETWIVVSNFAKTRSNFANDIGDFLSDVEDDEVMQNLLDIPENTHTSL